MIRHRLALGAFVLAVVTSLSTAQAPPADGPRLYNGYERPKNGPPLTNIFNKARPAWIRKKLRNPQHHPAARMPDFRFSEDEVLDMMAYLASLAAPPTPAIEWPAWAAQEFEDLDEEALEAVLDLTDRGQEVWNNARCSVCHSIHGPVGGLIGGFVDLRVGGIDLQIEATKLRRDWLYRWIRDPKDYFPQTLMPRFRLTGEEVRALIEYILRDDAFMPEDEDAPLSAEDLAALGDGQRVARGRRLIELDRCVVCHDIAGIPEVLPQPAPPPVPPAGTIEFLVWDVRCLTCHSIEGRGGTYAPILTNEGSRLRPEWLRTFVQAPDTVRPLSQQMPNLHLSDTEAGLVVAYMTTERIDPRIPADVPGGPLLPADIDRGREAFLALGCRSCHTFGEGQGGSVGPNLEQVGDRLRPGYIWFHLKHPHAVNPYSAEPDYGLNDEDARALAAYLAGKKP